jgi:hypothetical protein
MYSVSWILDLSVPGPFKKSDDDDGDERSGESQGRQATRTKTKTRTRMRKGTELQKGALHLT